MTRHFAWPRGCAACGLMVAAMAWMTLSVANAQARAQRDTPFGSLNVLHQVAEPPAVRFQLWVAYDKSSAAYRDHASYLAELQSRHQAKGVVVGVVMPLDEAKAVAKAKPTYLVLAPHPGNEEAIAKVRERVGGGLLLCDDTASIVFTMATLDGIEDALGRLLAGGQQREIQNRLRSLHQLVQSVADGGSFAPMVDDCLKALPKSGRAHAVKALMHWWCEGDVAAAERAVANGLEALAGESLPLLVFADLVLRGDRSNPELAQRLAAAVAPLAKKSKHDVFSQLVYLRALLQGGDRRMAGRIAATLPKRLKGRPMDQLYFAETLMEGSMAMAYRDMAERMLDEASSESSLKRWIYCARHKVLSRCGDAEGAAKLMDKYRLDPVGQTDLNNDAWYLMVQPATMGRFDTLAYAQASKMGQGDGAGISTNNRDTYALSCFRFGLYGRAAEQQKQACKGGGTTAFAARLKRYETTLAAAKHRKAREK